MTIPTGAEVPTPSVYAGSPTDPPDDPLNAVRAAEHRAQAARRAVYQRALRLALSGRRDLAVGLRRRMPTMTEITKDDQEG